jgi:type IV pilus assembly protein PilO
MATKSKKIEVNLGAAFQDISGQFQGLDPKEPGQWPFVPKLTVWVLAALAVVLVGWFFVISDEANQLQAVRDQEPRLKEDYDKKLSQAVNLEELRKQKEQVQEYVTQLEKQLPGKAEMDALLTDINRAGVGRGLQFDLFKPGQVVIKDYYAELPISIRVLGHYHDIGSFAADVANLSRIVTLHDLSIAPAAKDTSGMLTMEATARTYRYLDPQEVAEVKKAAAAKKAGKKKGQ